ncbi:MAG: hypothetical protein QQN41_05245 [Nitrosopumilus sp.]
MKGLEGLIYTAVLLKEDMSLSEIQGTCLNTSERTVIRAVKELVKIGTLEHKRIHGKGKRKRYIVKEEKIKNDITIKAFKEGILKKGMSEDEMLALRSTPKITQRNLSSLITQDKQFYRKEIAEIKQFGETEDYYFYHIALISKCLEWITRLTFAIYSGMLGDSTNKLALARRNIERYEEWIKQLCDNTKVYDEKLGEKIIKAIHDELTNAWFLENLSNKH